MKIGLIQPSKNNVKGMPLGMAALAGYIYSKRNDSEIKFIDTGVYSQNDIKNFLNTRFDIVGITSIYANFYEGISLAKQIREKNPHAKLIIGGPFVSLLHEKVLQNTPYDYAVFGEGEATFNELIDLIKNDSLNSDNLGQIDGLIYRKDSDIVKNKKRNYFSNLDELPFPAYSIFPRKIIYKYGSVSMETLRGCPYNCIFCGSGEIWGRNQRRKSVERSITEIKNILNNYPKIIVSLTDDSFNINKKWVNEFCDRIISEKLKFIWNVGGIRIDQVELELSKKIYKSGCYTAALGIESADPRVLKNIKKGFTPDVVSRNVDILRSAGFKQITGQFMIGNPGDTIEVIKRNIEFAKKTKFSSVSFYTTLPFPSTQLWDYVNNHGRFLVEPDVAKYDEIDPRIVFETDDFPKSDRLEAVNLAKQANFYYYTKGVHGIGWTGRIKQWIKSLLLKISLGKYNLGTFVYYYYIQLKNKRIFSIR